MRLTVDTIKRLATDSAVFTRGMRYYMSGRVESLKLAQGDSDFEASATVSGSKRYEVRVNLDAYDMGFLRGSCTCPAFSQYSGCCKHIIAVLLKLMKQECLECGSKSDGAGRSLIAQYTRQNASATLAAQEAENAPVTLMPILEFAYAEAVLRLRLGRERLYVVQDFSSFYESMMDCAPTSYGKQFSWNPSLKAILPEDRPLASFLLTLCASHLTGNNRYSKLGPALSLGAGELDRFFALMTQSGRPLLFRDKKGHESPVHLSASQPRLRLQMDQKGNQGLSLQVNLPEFALGAEGIYMAEEGALHMGDGEAKAALQPLLRVLSRNEQAFLGKDDLPAFFGTIYPVVAPYAELSGNAPIEEYLPLPMTCRVELDAPSPSIITGRLLFVYPDQTVNAFEEETGPSAPRRDYMEEQRALMVLERELPLAGEDVRYFEGDDEAIYHFLTERVPRLERLGELFISDRLKRFTSPPTPKVFAGVSLGTSLLNLNVQLTGFPVDELAAVLSAYRTKRRFYRLRAGEFLPLEAPCLCALSELSEMLRLSPEEIAAGSVTLPLYRAMYLDTLMRDRDGVAFGRDDRFRALIRTLKNVADSDYPLPAHLRPVLRGYQKTGFRWLSTLADAGFHGILADDMGLGKTLQVIALLCAHRERTGALLALVACPASLVLNWQSELSRFAPALSALPLMGNLSARRAAIGEGGAEILITSYDALKRDAALYQGMEYDYFILDEAQYIKNPGTQVAKAVKTICARQRFALTGTPVENRLSELWSIFDFLMPGYFFEYGRFREEYELPAVKQGDEEALSRIQRMAAPFILRRMKADVLTELPEKIETVRKTALAPEQRMLYEAALLNVREEMAKNIAEDTLGGNKLEIFALLTRLRQLCCDPRLCMEGYNKESAKLQLCLELTQEAVSAGHSVLLFSQFTSMLALIREELHRAGISSLTLEGSTPKAKRQKLVEDFQSGGADVFLISLKAGGLGLNLTRADVVIIYDPWWNTAAETQAADRAYRIGQTNRVQVYKLIAKDTIEEGILALQEQKRNLSDSVVSAGNALSAMTDADWQALLGL